jgi:hypothetical protein
VRHAGRTLRNSEGRNQKSEIRSQIRVADRI